MTKPSGSRGGHVRRCVATATRPTRRKFRELRDRFRFALDLRRLNDVLAASPVVGRYRVSGGLLLGWARDRKVLSHDVHDADFYIDEADFRAFEATIEDLVSAGFERSYCFRNNEGRVTQLTLRKHAAIYCFFKLFPSGDAHDRYYVYGDGVQVASDIPRQQLEQFEFLGRTWWKPIDHELELEATYGPWRTPDTAWSYLNDKAAVSRTEWVNSDLAWPDDLDREADHTD